MAFNRDNVRVFLTVLDEGSFSAAARKLGKVPSAVSMAIAQLEAELDLQLFDRSSREPLPTAAARALEPGARQLAWQWQQLLVQAASLHAGLEDCLRLAVAPELIGSGWDAPLAELAQMYPQLPVDIRLAPQEDALRLLHDGEVQLAVVFERPLLDERECFQEISQETLIAVVAASHPLAQRLLGQQELLVERQVLVAGRDLQLHHPVLLQSRCCWRSDSHTAALKLIEQGLGWAFLPQSLVAPGLASGELEALQFANMTNAIPLWVDLVWLPESLQGLAASHFVAAMEGLHGSRPPRAPVGSAGLAGPTGAV
ncbi:LysR family transcriptional regulator [Parathalassolituus penaei]|uniref:LysR family transcriptional regulator n=1 Tax=Parathalassolituus penaei TaxID=2997323 RepID=A0A9X3EN41_9GAMM|nr:LysR family transcriptional regulator [Parathalassolituus penaei]MCY0965698.1 LysR family transcriptional regulator [Parathalassolituus penaei]